MDTFYENGLHFKCTQCSLCCRGASGYVFLSKNDLLRLANHLNLSEEQFLEKHTRIVPYNGHLRVSLLEEKEDHQSMRCEFWQNGCSVYAARPTQCRTYPFWPQILKSQASWQQEATLCPGIGQQEQHFSAQEIQNLLNTAELDAPIELPLH